MRFNDKELLSLSRQRADKAAELHMRGPKKGSVSGGNLSHMGAVLPTPGKDVTVLKKRMVKLVVNFLFYYRADEEEPIGALLLEHCRVIKEEEKVFSIHFFDETEKKYLFECSSQEECEEWIKTLTNASYEFMRRSLLFYRNEILKMTGKDPLEQYGISAESRFQLEPPAK